jgi:hypothetical protein
MDTAPARKATGPDAATADASRLWSASGQLMLFE